MTIATATARVSYNGDGATTILPVPFVFFGAAELRVVRRVIATGIETVLTLGVDYTISGGNGAIGAVQMTTAPLSTQQIFIIRNTARTQLVDYVPNDPFPAETHERALDRLTAIAQEIERDITQRAVLVPETETAVVLPASPSRAGQFLAFDSAGQPVPALPPGSATITPYMQTVLAAGTSTAAAGLLNVRINNNITNLREFGVVGDGVADDTTAWQSAINAGRRYIEDTQGGTYRITAALPTLGTGRQILGMGRHATIFTPSGSFQLFTFTGAGGAIRDVQVLGTGHTGGGTLRLENAQQFTAERISFSDALNAIYAQQVNTVTFNDLWGGNHRGTYTCRLFGQGVGTSGVGVLRSDIISFNNCVFSANSTDRPLGLDWDGNVHTVFLNNASWIAGHSYGMRVRNTSAGTPPALLEATQANFEFCQYGAYFEAGSAYEFTNLYSLGHSIGDGLFVGSLVNNFNVRVSNGKITGNAGWGVRTTGLVFLVNVEVNTNTLGDYSGPIGSFSQRHYYDTAGYIGLTGTTPQIVYDPNDFEQYNRATDRKSLVIGGVLSQGWQPGYSDFGVPPLMPTYTVAGLPAASSVPRGLVYVSNESGGAVIAFSDGTNWRRVTDRAIVS